MDGWASGCNVVGHGDGGGATAESILICIQTRSRIHIHSKRQIEMISSSDSEQRAWCVKCAEFLSKASLLLNLFVIIIIIITILLGRESGSKNFFISQYH